MRAPWQLGAHRMPSSQLKEKVMERQPVDSSNLASVGYDSNSEVLEVEFRKSGDV